MVVANGYERDAKVQIVEFLTAKSFNSHGVSGAGPGFEFFVKAPEPAAC